MALLLHDPSRAHDAMVRFDTRSRLPVIGVTANVVVLAARCTAFGGPESVRLPSAKACLDSIRNGVGIFQSTRHQIVAISLVEDAECALDTDRARTSEGIPNIRQVLAIARPNTQWIYRCSDVAIWLQHLRLVDLMIK